MLVVGDGKVTLTNLFVIVACYIAQNWYDNLR